MKTIPIITLILVLFSCNAQEKKQQKTTTHKQTEMTTEKFDIETFNKNKVKPVVHFDKIRQFEWILRLKMSKIYIENKNFSTNLVLDTIFRTSKSLELTENCIFRFKMHNG